MRIDFSKFQGTGNDFIFIDNRTAGLSFSSAQIAFLCHRRYGIGADGLGLLAAVTGGDFALSYYNSDGAPGSLCGNGSRCAVAFAHLLGIQKAVYTFKAFDGWHTAYRHANDIQMSFHTIYLKNIQRFGKGYFLDTGSPHYVCFLETQTAFQQSDILTEGRSIRYNKEWFSEGANVHFVWEKADNCLLAKTYERGVEAETLSCGSGAVAMAAIYGLRQKKQGQQSIRIQTQGGILSVRYNLQQEILNSVTLQGAAEFVFQGHLILPAL